MQRLSILHRTEDYYPHLPFPLMRINYVTKENNDIISLIRKINPNRVVGPGGISGHMLLLRDESVILPLQIILQIFCQPHPDMWKLANVLPIFKKGNKQLLIQNYRPISFPPVCGKILEKFIFNNLYTNPRTIL